MAPVEVLPAEASLVPVEARQAVEALLGDVCERATGLQVTDADSMQRAGDLLLGIRELQDKVVEKLEPWVKDRYLPWKAMTDLRGRIVAQLKAGDAHLVRQRDAWRTAEDKRLADEEAARLALTAAARATVEDKVLEVATAAEAAGDTATAAALVEHAAAPRLPVPGLRPVVAQTPGLAVTKRYRAQFHKALDGVDTQARLDLARAVVAGKAPAELIALDGPMAALLAKKYGREGEMYPGVMVVEEKSERRTAQRGGRGTEDGM